MAFTLPGDARPATVTLRVTDADAVAAFYTGVVGLERLDDTTLGTGDTPLIHLVEDAGAGPRPADAAGLYHLAIRVPDRAALGAVLERVRDADAALDGAADHGVSEAIYLYDPAGNGVEVYRDRPREAWPEEDGALAMPTERLDLDALAGDAGDGGTVPDGTTLGHVHLSVTDVEGAAAFYTTVCGFRVRASMERARFLAADDYHHHLGLNSWDAPQRPREDGTVGLDRVTFRLPDADALAALTEQLAAEAVDHADEEGAVTFTDPDNIPWRFVADVT